MKKTTPSHNSAVGRPQSQSTQLVKPRRTAQASGLLVTNKNCFSALLDKDNITKKTKLKDILAWDSDRINYVEHTQS